MKPVPTQGKYRYFVGIDLSTDDLPEHYTNNQSKAGRSPKVNDDWRAKKVADTPKNKDKQEDLKDKSQNLKAKYSDKCMTGTVKYDYGLILGERSNKNLPENSPINKLSPVKLEQAIQEANQTKKVVKKAPINEGIVEHKQNKQPAIYFPFSPKEKSEDFYEVQPRKKEQNFVNPYYQSFILGQKNVKIGEKRETKQRKVQNKSETKVKDQREKSPMTYTPILPLKQEKMYICKMDDIERPPPQAKIKPKKDNSPYLLNFYENNPESSVIRYNPSFNQQQQKNPNRKTNQIYAVSMARVAEQPAHS